MNLTTIDFITKANLIHNCKYNYDNSIYISSKEKLIINCNIHGNFVQIANVHLRGGGCPKCSKPSGPYTLNDFIEKGNKIHNNKYDYSKSIYTGVHKKLIIICPIHGEFLQTPNTHFKSNYGCNECASEGGTKNICVSLKDFIDRSNIKHNFKYDYSKVIYIKDCLKVKIICLEHGEFMQKPKDHYRNIGCKQCSKSLKISNLCDTKKFIEKAILIHGNKYDYSKVDYVNYKTKILIGCKTHGFFLQNPEGHLQGNNCRKCSQQRHGGSYLSLLKYKPEFKTFLYHFKLENKEGIFYKIGISVNPVLRLNSIMNKGKLLNGEILETISGLVKDLVPLEKEFHETFLSWGTQYKPLELIKNGYTECYKW